MTSIAQYVVFVGIDYHDCSVQVCVLDTAGRVLGNRSLPNDVNVVFEYVDTVAEGRVVREASVEACCGTSNFAEQLRKRGWDVQLAHAGTCSKMKQNPDKTDFSDAHLLADLCRVGYLPRVWLPPKEIRDLRRLGRYRQQLAEQRRNVKLRIRAMLREERISAPSEAGSPWTKAWVAWARSLSNLDSHSRWIMDNHLEDLERLVAKIRDVECRMETATKDDPVVQKLRATKGVGLVTAVVMRAEIGSFDRFQRGKQLARYCAVTPKNASSGNRQADAGLIRAGNLGLRTIIIETAHRLAQYDPKWRELKEQLKSRGKPASVAAAAVANRWVRKLYWEMRETSSERVAA